MLCPAKFYTLRLSKEHNLYTKEAEELKVKLDKFKAEKAEDWDINNTVLTWCLYRWFRAIHLTAQIDSDENDGRIIQNDYRQRDATR